MSDGPFIYGLIKGQHSAYLRAMPTLEIAFIATHLLHIFEFKLR